MDRRRNPPFESTRNVLRLAPPLSRRRPLTTLDVAMVHQERAVRRREQRAVAWLETSWVLLAWILSLIHLRSAIANHVVFGIESSIAFVVAVALPIARGRRIFMALRRTAIAVKEARAARRAKAHASDANPQARGPTSGLPLQ
jgi:hypothetical protein